MRLKSSWLVFLAALLVACNVRGIETPQPTVSPIPTPRAVLEYLPLILHRYPRVARGVGGGLWGVLDAPYHHWTITPTRCDPAFARTVWCVTDYHLALYTPQIEYAATHCPGGDWTILNEPDDSGGNVITGQCGAYKLTGNPFDANNPALTVYQNPAETARRVIAVYDLIHGYDPGARVFVGGLGWIGHQISRDWWSRFVAEAARSGRLDVLQYVHFHAYPYGSFPTSGMQAFRDGVAAWIAFNEAQGAPTSEYWITETGGGSCSRWTRWDATAYTTIRNETMTPMQAWMDSEALALGVTRVYWFVSWDGLEASWWCNYLIDARDVVTVTALGEAWK